MALEENKALVRRLFADSLSGNDPSAIEEIYAADCVIHGPAWVGAPPGPEGVRLVTAGFPSGFPDVRYTVEDLVAERDRVAARYTWRGTHSGTMAGIPPTGRAVTASGMIVCRIEDGKIAEEWDCDDRLDVMQQLGLLPSTPPTAGD